MKRILGLCLATLLAAPVWADTPATLTQAIAAYNNGNYAQALPVLQKAAAAGNAEAETDLGDMYYHGLGTPKDPDTAFYLQTQAAAQHNGKAEDRLGGMYDDDGDAAKAFMWDARSAADGDPGGEADLAYDYLYSDGTSEDLTQALVWNQRAAAQNNQFAQYELGRMYHHGWGVDADQTTAVRYFQLAADQGEADAQEALGKDYENGDGEPQNYAQALHWFTLAADETCGCAAQNIGHMYENGEGVTQNYATAITWYKRAAALGNTDAEDDLGYMYENGEGVPADQTQAAQWYSQASAQNDQFGSTHLAIMYLDGRGVEQNTTEAHKLLALAIGDNDIDGEEAAGTALRDAKHYAEALPYLTEAADAADPNAQINLGYMYEQGEAVPQSYQTELTWALITGSLLNAPTPPDFTYSSSAINHLVHVHIDVATPHLTQSQINTAKANAIHWLNTHNAPYDRALLPQPTWYAYANLIAGILIIYALAKLNAGTRLRRGTGG
jgi:TPR repeat protein